MLNLIIVLAKSVFFRLLRKMQWKAILPMLLECSLNLNTCMQYAASFLAVNMTNFQIKSLVICMLIKKSICRMFHFCVSAEALPLLLQKKHRCYNLV